MNQKCFRLGIASPWVSRITNMFVMGLIREQRISKWRRF